MPHSEAFYKKPEECHYSFFQNKECEFFPCHKTEHPEDFNCLFCYCPMYTYKDCLGNPTYKESKGKIIKVCTKCSFPHDPDHYDAIMQFLRSHR